MDRTPDVFNLDLRRVLFCVRIPFAPQENEIWMRHCGNLMGNRMSLGHKKICLRLASGSAGSDSPKETGQGAKRAWLCDAGRSADDEGLRQMSR